MSSNYLNESLYLQLLLILESLSHSPLSFFSDFQQRWLNLLYNNILVRPLTVGTSYKDYDQVYTLKFPSSSGFEFKFHFDIAHIYMLYDMSSVKRSNKFFSNEVLNVNNGGKCFLDKKPCLYNYYSKEERNRHYDNPIFTSLRPMLPETFFVIDGNHHLSSFIDKEKNQVPAVLINPYYAAIFFTSSAEAVSYAFLIDAMNIIRALINGNEDIEKKALIIYQNESVLDILRDTDRLKE